MPALPVERRGSDPLAKRHGEANRLQSVQRDLSRRAKLL